MAVCTKLVQWLTAGGLLLVLWYSVVAGLLPIQLSVEIYDVIVPLPVYFLVCFGCYSLAVIGFRLISFNDCENASRELMEEILEAKRDLTNKGMKL